VTVVAIHQPNFFPWLGFFDKMARCDTFVLMDNVQLPNRSLVNRVRLMISGEPRWATVPVLRAHGTLARIGDVMIDESQPWRPKLARSIEMSYAKSPHFKTVFPAVKALVENPDSRLAGYNAHAIRSIAGLLGLSTPLVLGSDVGGEGQATELLASMVRRVPGDAYLCGAGAAGYQDDDSLRAAGIKVVHQNFEHPAYPQTVKGQFVPGLSVIDVLMNQGADATRRFLGCEGASS